MYIVQFQLILILALTNILCFYAGRADPNCALGHVLKVLFKNDDFMTKVSMLQYNNIIDWTA